MNIFDFFNSLTLFGKIVAIFISAVAVVIVLLTINVLRPKKQGFLVDTDSSFIKKESKSDRGYDITLPDGTIKRVSDKAEEKQVRRSFENLEGKSLHGIERSRWEELRNFEPPLVEFKPQHVKQKSKKEEHVMKLHGFCDFCGKEIGGPTPSREAIIMSYDPERVESARYSSKELLELPFVCNYCGGTFCSEHRLPENHNCDGL